MKLHRPIRWLLFAVLLCSFSAAAFSQVFVSVRIGPPALPIYAQPICPGPGYVWTPGYWAWDDDEGYYWVPGTWVVAPVGLLWTPGYWGWNEGFYVWHAGYWGPHVGFYGGINYGFGYAGVGFVGGEWRGREFFYNRSVTNVNVVNVTNVYNKTVIAHNDTRVAFNGGNGGVAARPTRQEEIAVRERHEAPLAVQTQHREAASRNRELFARVNQGRPAVAATVKPADFHSAVPAKAAGAVYHAPAMSPKEARGPARPENRAPAPGNERGNARSNEARPFTPPAKNNGAGNDRPSNMKNNRPESASRPSENRPNTSRPSENRPSENRPNTSRPNENRPSENRPQSHPSNSPRENASRPQSESRPQHESRPAPRQESRPAPQHESRPAPAHEAAPKPAPQPRHESAPPQRKEAAPKPEKEHKPGRGR